MFEPVLLYNLHLLEQQQCMLQRERRQKAREKREEIIFTW